MPPPKGTPNILEGPGDYDVTKEVHSDTYPAIDPSARDLTGKRIFISGGSRGIGLATALSYAKAGASHIAVGARTGLGPELQREIAAAAASAGRAEAPTVLPLTLDVTDRRSVEAAAAEVDRVFGGRVDVVVNNAGTLGAFSLLAESDPEAWRRVFDVNFFGQYLVARSFVPLLQRSAAPSPYLVHVASVAAHLLNPTASAYEISKLAVTRLAQLVHAEYSASGVVAFSVHPGNSPTAIMGGPEGLNEKEKLVFTETTEIGADTIVFLTSERREWLGGRYINCTWDMPELMAMEKRIVDQDLLKIRLAI